MVDVFEKTVEQNRYNNNRTKVKQQDFMGQKFYTLSKQGITEFFD